MSVQNEVEVSKSQPNLGGTVQPIASTPFQVIDAALEQARAAAVGSVPGIIRVSTALKPGGGAEAMTDLVLSIARHVRFEIPGMPVDQVEQDAQDAVALRELAVKSENLHIQIDHGRIVKRSDAWSGTLAYYSALSGFARTNPEVHAALAPMREFMSKAKRQAPAAEPTVAAAPVAK